MAEQLYQAGVDVPFLSVLTPYPGTPSYRRLVEEGRILSGRGWEFYNGYNVSFQPRHMSPERLLKAHRALWREAFSLKYSLRRIVRSLSRLRFGAFLMCFMMNAFYCLKRLRGNEPLSFDPSVSNAESGGAGPKLDVFGTLSDPIAYPTESEGVGRAHLTLRSTSAAPSKDHAPGAHARTSVPFQPDGRVAGS